MGLAVSLYYCNLNIINFFFFFSFTENIKWLQDPQGAVILYFSKGASFAGVKVAVCYALISCLCFLSHSLFGLHQSAFCEKTWRLYNFFGIEQGIDNKVP